MTAIELAAVCSAISFVLGLGFMSLLSFVFGHALTEDYTSLKPGNEEPQAPGIRQNEASEHESYGGMGTRVVSCDAEINR